MNTIIKPADTPNPGGLLKVIRHMANLPCPGISQFEELLLTTPEEERLGTGISEFLYSFDQDGHSQYDQTLRFSGEILLDSRGNWSVLRMRVEHIGDDATYTVPEFASSPTDQ